MYLIQIISNCRKRHQAAGFYKDENIHKNYRPTELHAFFVIHRCMPLKKLLLAFAPNLVPRVHNSGLG